MSLITVSLFIM